MADLLLELFSEEIPARMQAKAAQDFERLILAGLKEAGLKPETSEAHVTPRRLTLMLTGLPLQQADYVEERKGPRVDAPAKALEGFLRATGLKESDLERRQEKKGEVFFARLEHKGRALRDLLPEIVQETVTGFPWPKSMRWGSGKLRWVRPLHSILCLLDGEALGFEVEGVPAGATTEGHRFLSARRFSVASLADYRAKLDDAFVMLDREERKRTILEGAERLAAEAGLTLVNDPGLLEEVAGLVEYPVPLLGSFDEAFLELPEEVLMTSMRTHQKYFSLRNKATGKLSNHFLSVANNKTADGGALIRAGNEKVLRARLSDAAFFWSEDQKVKLEARSAGLSEMVFHARLGSVAAKTNRLSVLSGWLAERLGGDPAQAKRAGQLAKADLLTDMVYEFPELQGLMGDYYARLEGEPPEIAEAIAQHYSPAGPTDETPSAPVAIAVALADKLDTLTGFWAIDEKPTGSKDPYALRRAALGVIRIVLENHLRLDLEAAFRTAAATHEVDGAPAPRTPSDEEIISLQRFFQDRLKVYLRDQGKRYDIVDAIFAHRPLTDLMAVTNQVSALEETLKQEEGAALMALYNRACSILAKEEKNDKTRYTAAPDEARFEAQEERDLFDRLQQVAPAVEKAVAAEDPAAAMTALAALRAPVDEFFDKIMVNAEDPDLRVARLSLLGRIRALFEEVADFSKLEG